MYPPRDTEINIKELIDNDNLHAISTLLPICYGTDTCPGALFHGDLSEFVPGNARYLTICFKQGYGQNYTCPKREHAEGKFPTKTKS